MCRSIGSIRSFIEYLNFDSMTSETNRSSSRTVGFESIHLKSPES